MAPEPLGAHYLPLHIKQKYETLGYFCKLLEFNASKICINNDVCINELQKEIMLFMKPTKKTMRHL
jgi:hypothetical protein